MYRETMYPGLGITDLCLKRIYPFLSTPNKKTSLQTLLSGLWDVYFVVVVYGPKDSAKTMELFC